MMKVISVKQPWAYLLVSGIKNVENRTWRTNYTGPLLIHASKQWDCGAFKKIAMISEEALRIVRGHFVMHPPNGCPNEEFSAIVGQVDLVSCAESPAYNNLWAEPELIHWNVKNAKIFVKPIPAKGKLGLWEFEL